jgi:TIR domain
MSGPEQYDVALSFAGEDRAYVEMVADSLRHKGVRVFYDQYEQIDLWGKNLYEYFIEIYKDKSRLTVLFISKHYKDKVWANHEKRAAQARALSESYEYILPARFDDTEIEGLLPTTGYLDLRTRSPEEVSVSICEKLGRKPFASKAHAVASPRSPAEKGTARFNYSNKNGRFRIGRESFEFETKWSKASGTSIHCYADTPTIRGVAVAPHGASRQDIIEASQVDFTSRVRKAREGGCVILQNHNGFYAALEILDIKDDSRGDEVDELTFRYWILRDGTGDFSNID